MPGRLYVVATPIGNLEDLSPRAIRTLREVDRIAAEDTRRTGRLLAGLGIDGRMTSYHDANERRRSVEIVADLEAGLDIALVSDAGTPLVSDPGHRLVALAVESGIEVVPIPGPCAATALLSVSGLPVDRFAFEGFLPVKAGKRRRRLEELAEDPRTFVLYVSPHHVERTLGEVLEVLGDRRVALGRELTKLHEEILRGPLSEVLEQVRGKKPRGEYSLAVAPRAEP